LRLAALRQIPNLTVRWFDQGRANHWADRAVTSTGWPP
jgi:hypothetical protein